MPHDKKASEQVIPVSLIRGTVMPPYEYQKPQNGFGSIIVEAYPTNKKDSEKPSVLKKSNLD